VRISLSVVERPLLNSAIFSFTQFLISILVGAGHGAQRFRKARICFWHYQTTNSSVPKTIE
jgi:hypothetical protein